MDFEIATEILKSGVVTEIFKQVCASTGKGYDKLKAQIANACHQYDKNYRERHGQVKVFCVGMRKPIPLDDVYVAVQFLNQHTASPRYRSPEDIEQAFRERGGTHFDSTSDKRQDGIQVANDKQYLMLLGGPGVGKSTFLRKIGFEALKGKDGDFKHKYIPVFLELKNFSENQIDIKARIAEEFETCGYPHSEEMTNAALELGKLLILFDGLDEVPAPNVDNVIRGIGDFVDRYNKNRFIASCRIAAYKGGFRRFTEVEMADFDDSQIRKYIKNWFDSTPDPYLRQLDKEKKTADRCWEMLSTSEHSATKELVRNPLLLTLLCMVYDDTQHFSRNRANLYADALDIFLRKWAAEKRVNRDASITQYLDIADEKRMLSEIAAKNFEANSLFFREDELIAQIQEFGAGNANTPETFNVQNILQAIFIDQGLFVERVRGSYSFSHLTFQEYLTANYIVGDPRSIQGLVNQHLHDPQWREIFLLTAGLMREADDLLVTMDAEAAKFINIDGIKSLFQWAKKKIDTTGSRSQGIVKRLFILRQFFSLWLLNKMYEVFENVVNHDQYLYQVLYRSFLRDLVLERSFFRDLEQDRSFLRDRDLVQHLYLYRYRDLNRDRYLYLEQDRYLYQDFYKYMDIDFYRSMRPQSRILLDKQLQKQITFVKDMENMKIFKGVNLQRMVQRFNEQREFIKEAAAGKSVEPPAESIHNTWLSVLGITDEMLAIPREALEAYITYLEAVELIVACKEAAGRVSPDVWQQIENRFLTVDAADIKN